MCFMFVLICALFMVVFVNICVVCYLFLKSGFCVLCSFLC